MLLLCNRSYLKPVRRYTFLILAAYHPNTVYLFKDGSWDTWLFFEVRRDSRPKKFGKRCCRRYVRRCLRRRQRIFDPCSSEERVGLNKGVRFILSVCKLRFADFHASCQFRCSWHQSGLWRGPAVLRRAGSHDRLGVVKGFGLSARLRYLYSGGSNSVQPSASLRTQIFCRLWFKLKFIHQVFYNDNFHSSK
jgi:hypothetical protein